ncbi:MAG: hypothetical protein ACLP07_08535 [Terracidiphilus sp.]
MNSIPRDPRASASASSPAEETLRLIASLPVPKGLEERVQSALDAAPRRGRVLAWPRTLRPESGWMRSAAAAAIVFVVAGGGWGVYMRVEQNQPAKVIVMPARMPAIGGFGEAGAIRTPQTLPGPKAPQVVKVIPAQPRTAKKPVTIAKPESGGAIQQDKTAAETGAPK